MMTDYFAVAHAIEQRLTESMPEIDKVCSVLTENDPVKLQKLAVSAHINMIASQFSNHSGHGVAQAEKQRWQVSLCFKSPKNTQEEVALRQQAGVLLLKLRQTLQGFDGEGFKGLVVVANHAYLTADCRFRIFGFTFEAAVFV